MKNNIISDIEDIARIIFAPSMVCLGRISPTAFSMDELPNGSEGYVSVWRMALRTPTIDNVDFHPRKDSDRLVGYAKLNTGECRKVSYEDCRVDVRQHGKNLYHAGIEFTDKGKRIKGVCRTIPFLMVTKILSTKATFCRF